MKVLKLSIAILLLTAGMEASARIVNRGVKETPKVCSMMKSDMMLSRAGKKVYGTLRHSIVIEDKIDVVNDLGKKICSFNFDALNPYGDVGSFEFYIDEYRNYLYPFIKDNAGVTTLRVSLNSCEIEAAVEGEQFETPKCSKPLKKLHRRSSKRRA